MDEDRFVLNDKAKFVTKVCCGMYLGVFCDGTLIR